MTAPRWQRDERALWRRAPDLVVVVAPGTQPATALRGTGASLWNALSTPATVDELVARLSAEFGGEPDDVRRDIAPVIAALAALGALREAP
jgi:hypothetical protein